MRCQKLNDFFSIISHYYFYTLYDTETNTTKIALFINRELRDNLGISIELGNKSRNNIKEILLYRVDEKDNILNRATRLLGRPLFDTSLYDVYCTEDFKFKANCISFNFNIKQSDQFLIKKEIPIHLKSDSFTACTEFWLYIVWMYNFNKDIKNMLEKDLKSLYSEKIDMEREEVKSALNLLNDQIENEISEISKYSEYYIEYSKNKEMIYPDFLKGIPDNEKFIDNFDIEYESIKNKIDRIIKEDLENKKIKIKEIKEIVEKDDEMKGVLGVSLQNFLAGGFVIGGILVGIYYTNLLKFFY